MPQEQRSFFGGFVLWKSIALFLLSVLHTTGEAVTKQIAIKLNEVTEALQVYQAPLYCPENLEDNMPYEHHVHPRLWSIVTARR